MEIEETNIPGFLVIKPGVFEDQRGYFYESYNERFYSEHGINIRFVQDNESQSFRNVVRGLHYQLLPHAQTKLLRVLEGAVFDVVVDLRKGSPSYKKWRRVMVSAENRFQLLIPKGCAHGLRILSDTAKVFYKCDEYYHPESERSINFADPDLGIDWGFGPDEAIVSVKDNKAPGFAEADNNFIFGIT